MAMPAHATGSVPSGDVRIFFRAFGKAGKTPLLLVHGLSYFSYDWIEIAAALAQDREVVAMDMRGFGDSTWSPSKDYAVPTFAQDMITLLDHLRWPRSVLIGHSMGGRNATYCAAEHPDRAAALVLVDYTPENARAGSQRTARTVAGVPDKFATIDAALAYFGADADSPQGGKVRARIEAYLKPAEGGYIIKRDTVFRDRFRKAIETGQPAPAGVDMWAALSRVRCPILGIRGTRSDMFAADTVERVKAANSRLHLVEVDSGHNVPGEQPEGLFREVRAFLAKEAL
jgi:esterase